MFNIENYNQEELTITSRRTNILGNLFPVPFVVLFCLFYYFIWGMPDLKSPFIYLQSIFGNISIIILLLILFLGIIIHELIHGLTLAQFASNGLASMKFGINWKYMAPYYHCKEPILVKHYIIGIAMPAIILGFIPCIITIFFANSALLVFGIIFIFSAGGDFLIINLLINEPKNEFVLDYPAKVGCYIYRPKHLK